MWPAKYEPSHPRQNVPITRAAKDDLTTVSRTQDLRMWDGSLWRGEVSNYSPTLYQLSYGEDWLRHVTGGSNRFCPVVVIHILWQ